MAHHLAPNEPQPLLDEHGEPVMLFGSPVVLVPQPDWGTANHLGLGDFREYTAPNE